MKEFKVQLTITEYYRAFVFADNEEQARERAVDMLNKGELMMKHNDLSSEVEATGYEEG